MGRAKVVVFNLAVVAVVVGWMIAMPAQGQEDPLKGLNEKTQALNDGVDRMVVRPMAVGYAKTPGFVRSGVRNVFDNLTDVNSSVNNVLQGKPVSGLLDLLRVLINTTVGLGGLVDAASHMGLPEHDETFSQTLAVWGVPEGPYLVLPVLGPSTLTDAMARPVDSLLNPVRFLEPVDHRNRLFALELLHRREALLDAESAVFGDRYIFMRDAYLQRRAYLVADGEIEDEF